MKVSNSVTGDGNQVQNKVRISKNSKISIAIGTVVVVAIITGLAMWLGGNGGSSGGGRPSALIGGVWSIEDGRRTPSGFPSGIEFFSDGTCISDLYSDVNHGAYSIDGKRLKITVVWDAYTYDFEVKGNTLSLTDWDETVVYKRSR